MSMNHSTRDPSRTGRWVAFAATLLIACVAPTTPDTSGPGATSEPTSADAGPPSSPDPSSGREDAAAWGANPSRLARLTFRRDFTPGLVDPGSGQTMGGTELMHLVGHRGALFGALGYWKDAPATIDAPGGQILRKDAPAAAWTVDRSFPGALRVSDLESFRITTDFAGRVLPAPVQLLVASAQDVSVPYDARVYCRNDTLGTWTDVPLAFNLADREHAYARTLLQHKDRVTGIDHIFAGVATSALYRGGYDPATGCLRFVDEPELVGTERMHSGSEANGQLFVAVGTNGNASDRDGGSSSEPTAGTAPLPPPW